MTSDKNKTDHMKKIVRSELEALNRHVNKIKTKEFQVKRKGNKSCKECKLSGSLSDTSKWIRIRKVC